jgi:hypothetical protein
LKYADITSANLTGAAMDRTLRWEFSFVEVYFGENSSTN